MIVKLHQNKIALHCVLGKILIFQLFEHQHLCFMLRFLRHLPPKQNMQERSACVKGQLLYFDSIYFSRSLNIECETKRL